MSAAAIPAPSVVIDRRGLLRMGLLATAGVAAVGVTPTLRATASSAIRSATGATGAAAAVAVVPAATWELLVGHELTAVVDGARTTLQLVDVRVAAADPLLRSGEAYSLLLDGPQLATDTGHLTVVLSHADLAPTSIVITPVNGDGSWEAVVDTRSPITSAR